MHFTFSNNRSLIQQRVYDAAMASKWRVSDVFAGNTESELATEKTRLEWAPVLVSLAFGEATAFSGFGRRIAEANDISTKTWLTVHLLDESKHTEAFSALLDHLYPTYRGRQEELLKSREVFVFYGHTHRTDDLLKWLICTQIAEIFGMHCYKSLHKCLAAEPLARTFFANIIGDEGRHISYINSIIADHRSQLSNATWKCDYEPFVRQMSDRARKMFEANRRGDNFHAFDALGIDVTKFCDNAQSDINQSILRSMETP